MSGLTNSTFDEVLIEFDRNGSLPTTHDTPGSDMGLAGGLMGWEADDERLRVLMQVLRDTGVRIRIETVDAGDPHPNAYRLTLRNGHESRFLRAISTGGGKYPQWVKAACGLRGRPVGAPRTPLCAASPAERKQLKAALGEIPEGRRLQKGKP